MANPKRILFVASEVDPFIDSTATSELARELPLAVQQNGSLDVRMMMPRYGTISERKNRLHEVIRLSGTDVPMGGQTSPLKVKVASVPDTRLQVYFMDSKAYFKRKGIYANANGELFEDNLERALFFGRAIFETLRKLRWAPDVLHAIGGMTGLVPFLLREEYGQEELFAPTRTVYTPEALSFDAPLTKAFAEPFGLSLDAVDYDGNLTDVGMRYADGVIYPPHFDPTDESVQLKGTADEMAEQALESYGKATSEVPA